MGVQFDRDDQPRYNRAEGDESREEDEQRLQDYTWGGVLSRGFSQVLFLSLTAPTPDGLHRCDWTLDQAALLILH